MSELRDPVKMDDAIEEVDPLGLTLRRIYEALAQDRSKDQGDTLDLSRAGIEGIGEDAVEMFRRGVGKDQRGVWR